MLKLLKYTGIKTELINYKTLEMEEYNGEIGVWLYNEGGSINTFKSFNNVESAVNYFIELFHQNN